MKIEVFVDADSVARRAAALIAAEARAVVADRDRFIIAVSHTPLDHAQCFVRRGCPLG